MLPPERTGKKGRPGKDNRITLNGLLWIARNGAPWREELRKNGHAVPTGEEQSEKWSSRDKFLIVVETMPMNETELSEYCRQKGLFPEQVKQWQEVCQEANVFRLPACPIGHDWPFR